MTREALDDGFFLVPRLYPQEPGAPLQISAGINGALALAIGLTDPATSLSLLDYLRGGASGGALDLIVTGHSLGAALAVVATAWPVVVQTIVSARAALATVSATQKIAVSRMNACAVMAQRPSPCPRG